MFKISPVLSNTYAEVHQINPMRWVMLFRESEDKFSCQTGLVKCKDFFNDNLAYFKHGIKFGIYGYTSEAKKNDEGVYFLLTNIDQQETFLNNLDVINEKLMEQLSCKMSYWKQGKDVVLLLPNPLWESTWRLSLITILVRCSNYGYKHSKWEDFFDHKAPLVSVDKVFDPLATKNCKAWGFLTPVEDKGYWFYAGPDYNSVKQPNQTGGVIHNNGCCNWSFFLKQAEKLEA
jgi:hypothetical protein